MRAQSRSLTPRPFRRGFFARRSRPARRMAAWALAAAGACLLLARPAARADDAAPANPEVRVTTNMGSFVIELRPDRAPLTVANFLHYVHAGFYNNTLFHRVVANFVIQGGGHDAAEPYTLKPTDPPVDNESGNGLQNKRGAVGLARAAGADTGNSQFYINLVDNPELDPLPTRWGYAVFGKIVQGMSVVDRIGVVPTGSFGPFKSDAPLKPVVIQSIEVITPPGLSSPASSPAPAATPSGTPPSGASSTGSSSSGNSSSGSGSGTPSPGASGSASPQPESAKPSAPAPSSAKPTSPPPAATDGKKSSGESDQPDGTSPQR